jgi:hypothetical protein
MQINCSDKAKSTETVAQVNSYYMSVADFKEDLKSLSLYRPQSVKTYEGRLNALNDILEKEILLQEAQNLNLDKDERFRKTIENYWKQTLLIMLIEKKAKEISDQVFVYDNEVQDYYKVLKQANPDIGPLAEVRPEIKRIIRSEKETALMREWIDGIKGKAYIKINEDVLKEINLK